MKILEVNVGYCRNERMNSYPICPELPQFVAPIVCYHGIESHLACECDKKLSSLFQVVPIELNFVREGYYNKCKHLIGWLMGWGKGPSPCFFFSSAISGKVSASIALMDPP